MKFRFFERWLYASVFLLNLVFLNFISAQSSNSRDHNAQFLCNSGNNCNTNGGNRNLNNNRNSQNSNYPSSSSNNNFNYETNQNSNVNYNSNQNSNSNYNTNANSNYNTNQNNYQSQNYNNNHNNYNYNNYKNNNVPNESVSSSLVKSPVYVRHQSNNNYNNNNRNNNYKNGQQSSVREEFSRRSSNNVQNQSTQNQGSNPKSSHFQNDQTTINSGAGTGQKNNQNNNLRRNYNTGSSNYGNGGDLNSSSSTLSLRYEDGSYANTYNGFNQNEHLSSVVNDDVGFGEVALSSHQRQAQHDYDSIDNSLNHYYPNGSASYWEPDYHDNEDVGIVDDNQQLMDVDVQNFNKFIDHHVPEEEVSLELSGGKLAAVFVALWYIILTVLIHNGFLFSDASSYCDDGFGVGFIPTKNFFARPDAPPIPPPADVPLHMEMYSMFLPGGYNSFPIGPYGNMPDLSRVSAMCSRSSFFYGMNKNHMQAIEMVKDMFMSMPNPPEMMRMAKAMRNSPMVNTKVWYSGLMAAAHERSDMSAMKMPGPMDAMPDNFIPAETLGRALRILQEEKNDNRYRGRNKKKKRRKNKENSCVRVDGSVGKDNGIENRLWYFREDLMVNSHHWYWHLSYPLINKVYRDRRGEMFYFVHRSMLQRYNIERLCNGLDITKSLEVYPGAPLIEGYNSHLNDMNSGKPWANRLPLTQLTDVIHDANPENSDSYWVEEWLSWRSRVVESVHSGYFISRKGTSFAIPRREGIDMLANTVEASDLSVNPNYYGEDGFHNTGHRIIGYIADPKYELMLPPGPMGDPATAMRDPIFYTWHSNINDIYEKHKFSLPPYKPIGGEWPLHWNGIKVTKVQVSSRNGGTNSLKTFWGRRKFDLNLGLAFNGTNDFDDDNPDYLTVCATHLNHEDFKYEIHIERQACAKSISGKATVRVFIAPKYDNHGHRYTMSEQRNLFTHLDVFPITLSVGKTIVTRNSLDSSLTIPWTKSLYQLQREVGIAGPPNCGCGWPHHLLLPKGTHGGMAFDLFVMVTNGDEDAVFEKPKKKGYGPTCANSPIYCGIQNQKYPDARPMGYPFDRDLYKIPFDCYKRWNGNPIFTKICSWVSYDWRPPAYLNDYMHGISNMASTEVIITHRG